MDNLLKVDNLVKWYVQKKVTKKNGVKEKKQNIKAVDGVSFTLNKGEILGVIGESGCGKSTLGRLLVALENPTKGTIQFRNENVDKILKENPLKFRRDFQMVFQNPFDTFDPRNNISDVLTTALKIHKIGNSNEERREIIIKAMEGAGIIPAEDYLYRFPHELSGGQLQRISIIRSMLLNPKFMVADEPVSMLDVSVRADIINMLLELTRKNETSLVFISHDIVTTRYISDKVAVMYLGRIVEMGKTDEVLHNPIHPYTRVLISNCASLDPLEKRDAIKISGEPPTPIGTGPGCYFAPRCYMACEDCKKSYPGMIDVGGEHFVSCFHIDKQI